MVNVNGRTFNIGRMKGRPVIDANGDNVGTVEDVSVDPNSWKVSGLVVTLKRDVAQRFNVASGGFLDQPRLELGSERIRTVGDNVILNIDMSVIGESLRRRDADATPTEPFVPPPATGVYDPVTGTGSPPGGLEPPPRY